MLPFGNIPFINDMLKAMAGQGPLNFDVAVQAAAAAARGDRPDPEVDPATRIAYNRLADIAGRHVGEVTGLGTRPGASNPEIHTTTRALWAHRTLTDLRGLFTELAGSLHSPSQVPPADPVAAMFAQMSTLLFPTLMGMTVGSMVGDLAGRAFGQYDLPLPRPASRDIVVVATSVEDFATEWSIPHDDLKMWVITHELVSHAVLSTPAVVGGLMENVRRYVGSFRPDAEAFMERIGEIDPSDPDALSRLQKSLSDPMVLVGALRSGEQDSLVPLLDAQVAAVGAYIDHVVDEVGSRLLGNPHPIAEAVRRRRLDVRGGTDLAERLLGISLSRPVQAAGAKFVRGVIERAGDGALAPMLTSPGNLPTPNEVEAPGLWLARLETQ